MLSWYPDKLSHWLMKTSPPLHKPLFKLPLDPAFPSQHAFTILRMCMLPRMNYFSRVFSPKVFRDCADFDHNVMETACKKLGLLPLNDLAVKQLLLPVFLGGFGLRSMLGVSSVASCSLSRLSFTMFLL